MKKSNKSLIICIFVIIILIIGGYFGYKLGTEEERKNKDYIINNNEKNIEDLRKEGYNLILTQSKIIDYGLPLKDTELKIKENSNILAQYSDSIVNIGYTDKNNKEIYTLQNAYIADIENSRYSFVIRKEEQNDIIKLKNTYVCIIINELGNEIARYNIGETTPKSVLAKLDSIVINLGTELVVINQNGWIRKKYNSAKEISRYDISRIYDNSLV